MCGEPPPLPALTKPIFIWSAKVSPSRNFPPQRGIWSLDAVERLRVVLQDLVDHVTGQRSGLLERLERFQLARRVGVAVVRADDEVVLSDALDDVRKIVVR